MLVTVLVMALAVSVEPFRIGMTVLMLNRPRPALQLLAFLAGGFAMGMAVGLVVLFALRRSVLVSSHFALPTVQILVGLLALAVAVAVAVNLPARLGRSPTKLATPVQRLLSRHSLSVAGIAGLGIALPSVDYLAALAVILASGATAPTQVAVLVMFNAVAFALIEVPLLAYLLAPEKTAARVTALHDWLRSRRRAEVAFLLAAAGCTFLAVGVAGL
ncbi:GAP family protein [Mycobacterium sp. 94-17]|uniref:GAP family protein n=1 Tax=Mycobacterium sp. 94-17 TaxID=2986147 RepID=UPI002D1F8D0E|nr:GAP family protein [Mycobacterium sp. 94-17]MEB4209614.1 GAP family protein [Mycobacterium sp. 94-17]